jgi:hypothetical protein
VLATDIDTSWLPAHLAGVEVRLHHIGTDSAPDGPFDLAHARLVLVYVSARATALATMIRAMRPGGWRSSRTPIRACSRCCARTSAHRGADLAFGRMDLATSPLICAWDREPTT